MKEGRHFKCLALQPFASAEAYASLLAPMLSYLHVLNAVMSSAPGAGDVSSIILMLHAADSATKKSN